MSSGRGQWVTGVEGREGGGRECVCVGLQEVVAGLAVALLLRFAGLLCKLLLPS